MSYEGYEQHICKNGHRFDTNDIYWAGSSLCPHCKEPSAFFNMVDQTNTQGDGVILDWAPFLLTPEQSETCPTCQNCKVVKQATYRIPTEDERQAARTWYNEHGKLIPFEPLELVVARVQKEQAENPA